MSIFITSVSPQVIQKLIDLFTGPLIKLGPQIEPDDICMKLNYLRLKGP